MAIEQSQGGAAAAPGKGVIWVSRIMSALPVLFMGLSSAMKLARSSQVVEGWAQGGYPAATLLPIGLVELACVIVYLIPRTTVLGAILVTGYLGGAVATHVRAGEAIFVVPFLLGLLAWGGLFLRDLRLRALLPLRK